MLGKLLKQEFRATGRIMLQSSVDAIREEHGVSVDQYFREVFKC